MAAEDDEFVSKRGLSNSAIWKWLQFQKLDIEQNDVYCRICRRHVQMKTGNTTNLFYHLRSSHPIEYTGSQSLRAKTASTSISTLKQASSASLTVNPLQQSLVTTVSMITPYERSSKRNKDISTISYFIAKDMLPVRTMEKPGFKRLTKVLDPRYEVTG